MSEFVSGFARDMSSLLEYKASLGYSPKTYAPRLRDFDRFCAEHYPNEACLSFEMVSEWLERRPTENAGGHRGRASTIRTFGNYLVSMGMEAYVLPSNFIGGSTAFTPYIFTDQELSGMFLETDKLKDTVHDTFLKYTVPVLLRLIYTCGLRPGEGLRLKCGNVNLDTGEILVAKTKMKKERMVVMSDDMTALMRKYMRLRELSGLSKMEFFFSNPKGVAYTTGWLGNVMNNCWKRANSEIDPDTLPCVRVYDLRHRFASATLCRWLDEGKNLYNMLPYLRVYMGHSSLTQTAYYIHILPENLLKSKGVQWDNLREVIPEAEEWEN